MSVIYWSPITRLKKVSYILFSHKISEKSQLYIALI